jgi:hypothetical protein
VGVGVGVGVTVGVGVGVVVGVGVGVSVGVGVTVGVGVGVVGVGLAKMAATGTDWVATTDMSSSMVTLIGFSEPPTSPAQDTKLKPSPGFAVSRRLVPARISRPDRARAQPRPCQSLAVRR